MRTITGQTIQRDQVYQEMKEHYDSNRVNIDISSLFKETMKKWEGEGMPGFFTDFWVKTTGFDLGSKEYAHMVDYL